MADPKFPELVHALEIWYLRILGWKENLQLKTKKKWQTQNSTQN